MVVLETEREAHALDGSFAWGAHDDGAVRKLSCLGDLQAAVDLVNGTQRPSADARRGVATEPGRQSERVGAARSERGLDQLTLVDRGAEPSWAARSSTSRASDSRPALRRKRAQAR